MYQSRPLSKESHAVMNKCKMLSSNQTVWLTFILKTKWFYPVPGCTDELRLQVREVLREPKVDTDVLKGCMFSSVLPVK